MNEPRNNREANKKSVKKYHSDLTDLKIRFLKPDLEKGVLDYATYIKEQAYRTGYNSVNKYILHLIEEDIQNNPKGLRMPDFKIVHTKKKSNNEKNDSLENPCKL